MADHTPHDFYFEEDDNQGIKIREYLHVIRKRLPIIIAITIVIFSWKLIDTNSKIPIYSASSDVLIEKNKSANNLDYQYYGYDPFFLDTQTQIIRSENVAKRVVDILELHKRYKPYFINANPVEEQLFDNIKNTVTGAIKNILPESIYSSKQPIQPSTENKVSDNELSREENDKKIIAAMVQGGLSVSNIQDTKIVQITYIHRDPAIARLVANAIVQAYKDVTLDIKLSSSNYTLQWMTAKAEEERRKLEKAEYDLQQYMRANDLVTVEDRLAVIPQKMNELSSKYTQAQSEKKELEEVYLKIKEASGNTETLEAIPLFASNSVLRNIRDNIFKAKQNIKELSKKYGYKHPRMIKAKDELANLENERKFEIQRIVASTKNSFELAKSKEENLQKLFNQTKGELLTINEKFVQYSMMKREVDTIKVIFETLTANIKKAGATEQVQSVNIWVVRKASLPGIPSYPNKKKEILMGLLIGLVLGGGVAFLLEILDNTIKSEKDLRSRFELTILGTVEELKGAKEEIESFIVRKPLSPLAESYRLVRSNLLLSSAEHPPRTILITSMNPKEGKTSTTINIARVLSQDEKKVLIIDCDLRKPRMHSLFGMDNKHGLSNYLTGNVDGNILYDVPGEDIKLIPSGLIPPNPAELLNSVKMKSLVDKMTDVFDFVLLDSPPIQRVTDSLAVSQLVDGTIVVVRAGKTTYEGLFSGMKKLKDVNTRFLGFVLNGLSKSEVGSGYYAGYNTYYAKDAD